MYNTKIGKNNLVGLYILMFSPFLFSILFGGHPISINGLFDDWDDVDIAYSDQQGDANSADFSTLKITYDSEFLFMYFNFFNGEFLMQDWNSFHLYIDADNNSETGINVHGIGAELDWIFGERSGYQHINNEQIEIWQNDLILRIAPTVTSAEFEIAISRNSLPLTMNDTQVLTQGKIVLYEGQENSDYLPDNEGGVSFNIDVDDVPLSPEPIILERQNESDIRIVSYNTLNEGIIDDDRKNHFKRILQALDPDIIALQEHSDWNEIDDVIQSWFSDEQWYASWTYRDLVVLSRFPILNDANMISSERTMAALLDTEDELGDNLLVFNSHLSCCANNEDRQQQVDEFAGVWRDWVNNDSGPFELENGTPFIHVGDFNYVGYRQQIETIRIGDIVDENQYGVDFPPDWDSTAVAELFPRQSHKRMGYTWRSDGSSFNPGKLDYIFFSDATIDSGKYYILNTLAMNDIALDYYNLQWDDTQEASDHFPLVFDISINDGVGVNSDKNSPRGTNLYPHYPNPFNTSTMIHFAILNNELVQLKIYNLLGVKVKTLINEKLSPGEYRIRWDGISDDGSLMPGGFYFYQLKGKRFQYVRKMVLVK